MSGAPGDPAEALERDGRCFEAARAWETRGDKQRALANLARVGRSDAHYREACRAAIRLAPACGGPSLAFENLLADYVRTGPQGAADAEAFKELVRTFQQKVFQLAFGFFHNREDAMDIVQETFMRLHQKIDTYKTGYNLQGWVMQIAKNLCVDYFRKNYRRRRALDSGKSLDELQIPAEENTSADRAAELKDLLSRSVQKLADKQRTIFIMRHYNQFQVEEIARMLNISPGTVKSLHFKAVQNLRGRLSPFLGVSR